MAAAALKTHADIVALKDTIRQVDEQLLGATGDKEVALLQWRAALQQESAALQQMRVLLLQQQRAGATGWHTLRQGAPGRLLCNTGSSSSPFVGTRAGACVHGARGAADLQRADRKRQGGRGASSRHVPAYGARFHQIAIKDCSGSDEPKIDTLIRLSSRCSPAKRFSSRPSTKMGRGCCAP